MRLLFIIISFFVMGFLPAYCDDFGVVPVEEDVEQPDDLYDDLDSAKEVNTDKTSNVNDVKLGRSKKKTDIKKGTVVINDINSEEIKSRSSSLSSEQQGFYNPDSAYQKKSTSFKKEKKFGRSTLGAQYDTSFTPDTVSQTRTLYSNYSLTKNLSINSSYSNNTLGGFGAQSAGTFSFGPQYKVNQHITLKNEYSRNVGDRSNKGGVAVNFEPFKDDRMNFNLGASQVQYDDGGPSRSQFNFGTQIKF